MKLEYSPYELKFRRPFSIAHGTRTGTSCVFIRLTHDGVTGYGEASLPPYLHENQESVIRFLNGLRFNDHFDPAGVAELSERIGLNDRVNRAACAGVSMALFDLAGKLTRQSLGKVAGEESPGRKCTSYTISMASPAELDRELEGGVSAHYIKVKLGGQDDMELIRVIRKHCIQPGWVDPNQGWKDRTFALEMAHYLKEEGFLFIEQPFPVQQIDNSAWLSSQGVLPVVADESCQVPGDLQEIRNSFSGVNVKLMKAGGMVPAIRLISQARAEGMLVMLGGMAESACAAAAAYQISARADYIDLDGPLLIHNDPFAPVHDEQGCMENDMGSYGHGARLTGAAGMTWVSV